MQFHRTKIQDSSPLFSQLYIRTHQLQNYLKSLS